MNNTNWKDKQLITICEQVEREYKMGGLSDGLYGDYAKEVAKRYATNLLNEQLEDYKLKMAQSNEWWNRELKKRTEELLERVEKEVIGDYVDIHKFINYENRIRAEGRNRLRSKQRQKLLLIKEEIK